MGAGDGARKPTLATLRQGDLGPNDQVKGLAEGQSI